MNYKFRNVSPKYNRLKDYEYIKIQTSKFGTIEDIRDFIKRVCCDYEDSSNRDIFSNRLFDKELSNINSSLLCKIFFLFNNVIFSLTPDSVIIPKTHYQSNQCLNRDLKYMR